MKGVNWKRCSLLLLPLTIYSSVAFAERSGFYTIVGPDGRIMVIDRNAAMPDKTEKLPKVATETARPQGVNSQAVQRVVEPVPAEMPSQSAVLPVVTAPEPQVQPSSRAMPAEATTKQKKTTPAQAGDLKPAVQPAVVIPTSNTAPAVTAAMPASPVTKPVATTAAQPAKAGAKITPTITAPSSDANAKNPVTVVNGEQYIDSEYLEQREFNLDGKKRFYALPDGMGRTQVLEREKGVDMSVFKGPKVEVPRVVTLSKDYERLDAEKVVSLTGVQCFSEKQLEKAKVIKEKATVDFWPRPSFEPRFDFVLARFDSEVSDIEFTSYAGSMNNPAFYWPLPIFLDKNACVLEGVNAFYQRNINATSLQHQGLQGFLHVPAGAKYILLTPLEAAADLANIKLTNKGQIRLTPVR